MNRMGSGSEDAVRRFAVPPAGKGAWMTILLLALVLPATVIGFASWNDPPAGDGALWTLAGVLAFVVVLGGGLALLLLRRAVELRGGMLVVKAAFYTRRVAVAELELARARVLDLAEHTRLKPALKTNGYALPGYQAGHFRLRDRSSAFALVTDRRRVLVLPVRGAATLLLSLERPQALLDALRRAASGTA